MGVALQWPWRVGSWARGPLFWGLLCVPALLGLLALAARPELFVGSVALAGDTGLPSTSPGPLWLALLLFGNVVVFQLSYVLLQRRSRRDDPPLVRSALGLVQAGLLAYISYRAAEVGWWIRFGAAPTGGDPWGIDHLIWTASIAAGLAITAGAVWRAFRDRSHPWRDLTLACGIVPLVTGLLEVALFGGGIYDANTTGLWRMAMAGLVAYAVASRRVPGFELRLASVARPLSFLLTVTVGAFATWGLLGSEFLDVPALALLSFVGLVLVSAPVPRAVGRALGRRAHGRDLDAARDANRLTLYRTALESALASGWDGSSSNRELDAMRRHFGIHDQTHVALVQLLQASDPEGPGADALTDRFELQRELGSGGQGQALLAWDTRHDRSVVLKRPRIAVLAAPEVIRSALLEAKAAASVDHPNVVRVHEIIDLDDGPVLVLEHLPGGSLADLVERTGPLAVASAVDVILQVLAGLDALHAAGMVHRDVKPSNILLDGEGRAVVADLGTASWSSEAPTLATGGSESPAGTPAYMAPEQVARDPVDARADVYAAAATLFSIVTGRSHHGLDHAHPLDAQHRILRGAPVPEDPRVPEGLYKVLSRALARDPANRFASARAFADALRVAVPPASTDD